MCHRTKIPVHFYHFYVKYIGEVFLYIPIRYRKRILLHVPGLLGKQSFFTKTYKLCTCQDIHTYMYLQDILYMYVQDIYVFTGYICILYVYTLYRIYMYLQDICICMYRIYMYLQGICICMYRIYMYLQDIQVFTGYMYMYVQDIYVCTGYIYIYLYIFQLSTVRARKY